MEKEKLKEIIEAHGKWLRGEAGGVRADLSNANLSNANLRNADLRYANLRNACLSNANLRYANLCDADLRDVNLCDADLSNVNLRNADLHDACLRNADLRYANLRNACLCDANLRYADLCGADLRDVCLRDADLCDSYLPEKMVQVGPIGSRKKYTIYWVDRDVVQCGCWNDYKGGSLEEFKKRVDKVYPDGKYRDEYMAAIAMFEALKEQKARREAEKE